MPTSPTTPTENDSVGLEEFGAVGRDSFSSSKDSPSKRHGLLGTLRTIGSMRSFKSANVKSDDYTAPLSTAYVHLEVCSCSLHLRGLMRLMRSYRLQPQSMNDRL
jgi:hypothetical protein